jgi:hypothetical protein
MYNFGTFRKIVKLLSHMDYVNKIKNKKLETKISHVLHAFLVFNMVCDRLNIMFTNKGNCLCSAVCTTEYVC